MKMRRVISWNKMIDELQKKKHMKLYIQVRPYVHNPRAGGMYLHVWAGKNTFSFKTIFCPQSEKDMEVVTMLSEAHNNKMLYIAEVE